MKPRTKLQFEVLYLSSSLPKIENKMLEWSKVVVLKHVGYATKNRVICMDCGERFSTELVSRKRAICPHCNTKLVVKQTRDRTNKQHIYVAIAQIYYDFQVIRYFELISYHKDNKPANIFIQEVLQHWILPTGKREVIALNHTANWYCDSWSGDMEIRDKGNVVRYDIYPKAYHPDSEFKAEYMKYGINSKLQGATALEAITRIPNDNYAETLLKAKQYNLLAFRLDRTSQCNRYWSSIKICIRNKYIVKDARMWFDYLDMLNYFNKDLHSPHYVCPKDLKKQHDIFMKRKRRAMEVETMKRNYISILQYFGEEIEKNFVYPKNLKKEYQLLVEKQKLDKLEKKKMELEEFEVKYKQFIEHFLNISIKDKLIHIVPLQTIDEFKEEGKVLNHCVYSNEYFKRVDCIILSARIDDKRLATIEINLKNMKIVQCRGDNNTVPEHYERIQRLVNRNIKQIKECFKLNQSA